MRLTTRHEGDTRRSARRLCVHAGETHAFIRKLVDGWCFVAANGVQFGYAQVAKADVVDQDVEDIRRLATVLLAKLGEFSVHDLVVRSPFIAILSFEDVVLGVVDELRGATGDRESRQGH